MVFESTYWLLQEKVEVIRAKKPHLIESVREYSRVFDGAL